MNLKAAMFYYGGFLTISGLIAAFCTSIALLGFPASMFIFGMAFVFLMIAPS